MYYNKENRKKPTEVVVQKRQKQRVAQSTKLIGKDLNVRSSVEGVGKWNEGQSQSKMPFKNVSGLKKVEVSIKRGRPKNKKKAKAIKNKKYSLVETVCISTDGSKDSIPGGDQPTVSEYINDSKSTIQNGTQLKEQVEDELGKHQSFIDCKSSSDSYYEVLPAADVGKQESIKYSITSLKRVNEKLTSSAPKLLLTGSHTGETDTDYITNTKESVGELHMFASGKKCCHLAKCLNEFSIMSQRGLRTSTNSTDSIKEKSRARENWRDKQSIINNTNDTFRSFSGYKIHSSFRKTQRWSAGNIGARYRYFDHEQNFPIGNSCKQKHEQSLLSAARFTSQALLQSLKQFNCDTHLNFDENKQALMEELQDISELLKLLHSNIEELKVSNAQNSKSLVQEHCNSQNSSSDQSLQQDQITAKKAENHENKNLISLFSVQKKTFRSGSSSESGREDKQCLGPPPIIRVAAKKKSFVEKNFDDFLPHDMNEMNRKFDVSLVQNENKLELQNDKIATQQTDSIELCTIKTSTTLTSPINKIDHSARPSVIDVSSTENMEHSHNTYVNSLAAQNVYSTANAVMTAPRLSAVQHRLLNCSRYFVNIMSLTSNACFNLTHQRGGFAFFLMILLFLFVLIIVYINYSNGHK